LGAIAALSLVAALFFLRFGRQTRDRLFLAFALSFGIEGLNRIALASTTDPSESAPDFYLIRLATFALILAAVLDKNRSSASTNG
jgi:uncharacterized membrane protein